MNRRDFLGTAAALPLAAQSGPRFVKSICSTIFPRGTPPAERFRQAKDAGFDAVELRFGDEIPLETTAAEAARIADAADRARVAIASLWVSGVIEANPLNSPDPEKRARGVEGIRRAVDCAAALRCGALLIVPGRLGTGPQFQVGYQDTWTRFTAGFRKLVPYAAEKRVLLTPENVWNKFLLSPLEMRAFVDQFHSPWLQTHFDVGNVMQYGYPQDWILTLGPRIKRVHFKDYKLSQRAEQGRFVDLLEGDVDWKAVMSALVQVGYRGTLSPEYSYDPNDPEGIRKISRALDRILAFA